jgi:hypothetical protein
MEPDGVRIINATNTQTRNLVILSKVLSLINKQILPLKLLRQQATTWSKTMTEEDSQYRDSTGKLTEIGSDGLEKETGAFSHYIDLLENIGLIVKMNEFVRCNKFGLLFNLLKNKIGSGESTTLSKFEQFFFFYILSSKDADALISILEILQQREELTKEVDIRRSYKDHLKSRFKAKAIASKAKVQFEAEAVYRNFERRRETILPGDKKDERTKPEHFASKHQVPNRLSWLKDLGLVGKSGHYFFLTSKGKDFIESIEYIDNSEFKDLNNDWLYNKSWGIIMQEDHKKISDNELEVLIGECLIYYFDFFGDDGAFRISLHPSFLFTVISLACINKVIVTLEKFVSLLKPGLKVDNKNFIVRISPRLSESYINISF